MKLPGTRRRRAASAALVLLANAALATAAPQEETASEGEEEVIEEDAEDGKKTFLAVVGGDIYTGDGAVLKGATLLARNRKIDEIGYDVEVPEGATVIHAEGMRVYPGLVAISSQGLLGTASDFADTIDPFDPNLVLGLAAGITSTGAGNSAVKLKRSEVKGAVMRGKTYVSLKWDSRDAQGKRSLREKLTKASEYLRQYRSWEQRVKQDKELKEPSRKGVDNSVLAVLRGETQARFKADERNDLLGIARLAQEFGFRPAIEGCREGWTVADELGRAGAMAIVTPRERRPKSEELVRPGGSTIENAALLHKAGVQIAVVPARESIDLGGIVGRDIMHLTIEADFAVRGGLSEQAALESITIVPARILGVSHRIGSLQVGKDCDLIVTDGDILHYQTFVQYAVVDAKLVYDKEKELFFAHIRPRPKSEGEAEADKPAAAEEAVSEEPPADGGSEEGDQPPPDDDDEE